MKSSRASMGLSCASSVCQILLYFAKYPSTFVNISSLFAK
jgi:hypothetical protein